MSQVMRKQDMPPPGGYKKIPFERIKPNTLMSGIMMLGGFAVFNTFTFYLFILNAKLCRREDIEMKSGSHALHPMLKAEQDRQFLKQLHRNRDAEAELMKDVEGWEVGTLFGEPIFKTLKKDTFWYPTLDEYYSHASNKAYMKRIESWLWC